MLCRPDVVASYPITPQTEVVEQLSRFHADGILDAEMIEVEGENSAMNAVAAATLPEAGRLPPLPHGGLVYMYDAVLTSCRLSRSVVMATSTARRPVFSPCLRDNRI